MKKNCYSKLEDKKVEKESPVLLEHRGSNELDTLAPTSKNGGLYSGPPVNNPWVPKPIYPSSTYLTNHMLKSANPPPGAIEQTIGINRPGNNYVPAPHVYWYNQTPIKNSGPFQLKVTKRK